MQERTLSKKVRRHKPKLLAMADRILYLLDRIFGPVMMPESEKLIKKARKKTGLHDLGEGDFRERLDNICEALREEPSPLTLFGRYAWNGDILDILMNRLQIQKYVTDHPEVLQQEICKPVFIIGLPRTGTTLLHRLLAQDPANRTPQLWEMTDPVPPPERATYQTDRRIRECNAYKLLDDYAMPALKQRHDLDACLPDECIFLMANAFAGPHLTMRLKTQPRETRPLEPDLALVYKFHKLQLQLLQSKYAADRWVLKSPFHLTGLKWLLQTYPDAHIIQTHRNPLKVLPSMGSLTQSIQTAYHDDINPEAIGEMTADSLAASLRHGMEARLAVESHGDTDVRFCDVYYEDLVADPIQTVRRVYDAFGMALSDEAVRRMRDHLDENPQHKHGKHHYSLEMFGLDTEMIRERFGSSCEHFGIECD